jgi:HSP20 family molecular chaperone IbpA
VNAKSVFKRLSEGINYEISVPGVKSKEDIIITKVENGIEIRAYTKDKCYIKTIPLKVDSYSYLFKDGKIFFQIKN